MRVTKLLICLTAVAVAALLLGIKWPVMVNITLGYDAILATLAIADFLIMGRAQMYRRALSWNIKPCHHHSSIKWPAECIVKWRQARTCGRA